MKGRKIGIVVIVILAIVALVFFIYKNNSKKEIVATLMPSVKTLRINITDIEDQKIKLMVHITLENNTIAALSADSMHHVIYIDNQEIARNSYVHDVRLEAHDTSTISFPITVYQDQLIGTLKRLEAEGKDSVDYKVETTVYHEMLPEDRLKLEITRYLPLYKIPEVHIVGLSTDQLDFTKAQLTASVSIYNKNGFDIELKDVAYELQLSDEKPIEGNMTKPLSIPRYDTTIFEIPLKVNLKELAKSVGDVIKLGKDMPYKLKINAEINSDAEIVKGGKVQLTVSGTRADFSKAKE